jgi:hypothetical protein
LKQYYQQKNQNLPQNLEHPCRQKQAPDLGGGEYDSQGKQTDKGFECLGAAKPNIQIIDDNRNKQDIQDILRSNMADDRNNIQFFILSCGIFY